MLRSVGYFLLLVALKFPVVSTPIYKHSIIVNIIFLGIMFLVLPKISLASTVSSRVSGHIVLQVEQHGEAWYVNPVDQRRYYLGRPDDAFAIMRYLGLGITNEQLADIPQAGTNWDADAALLERVRGRILLQVENHGEAWYVNPANNRRYYLGRPADAYKIMSRLGVGITDDNLYQILLNEVDQFNDTAVSAFIDVPFTAQAPFGDWSSPYNEACEEAILVMLHNWADGTSLSADEANNDISSIVAWEMKTYGHHEDTSADETARTAREFYNLQAEVSTDVSATTIRVAIAQKKPVIVPVFGQALHNPHYRNGGPYYHMLLVVGYEGSDFIVHDPGTRYGEQYHIPENILIPAIHDLTIPETNMATGQPKMIVIE
ncbi:MAG: C39 family peptidase [Patescibacteria group bacterium]